MKRGKGMKKGKGMWKKYMKELEASAKCEKIKQDKAWNRAMLKAKKELETSTK